MDQRRPTSTDNSLEDALKESQRWIEAVTGKRFAHQDFRQSLSDGILLCELINVISPRSVRRINRLPTTYAFLDNLKSFLQACKGLGLEGSQLFDTTDLQGKGRQPGPSTEGGRKLRNVAITLYWLGRKASTSTTYRGARLDEKAFQNLIGTKKSAQLYGSGGRDDSPKYSATEDTETLEYGNEDVNEWAIEETRQMERKRQSQELMLHEENENDLAPHEKVIRISKARRGESGFGFTVAGGENGGSVYVDSIKPGSSSALSNLHAGDEITYVNGTNVEGASKQKVLTLIGRGDVMGNISLRVKRTISSISSPDLVDRGWEVGVIAKETMREEDDETIKAEEYYEDDEDDEKAPPIPPPPDLTVEEKVLKEQARIERTVERRRQDQQEGDNSPQRWSTGGNGAPDGSQRRPWLEQDRAALEMVRAASVPRKPKHPFTLQDAEKRARSVEKEKEELEALKAKRRERERERGENVTGNVRAKASPDNTAILEGVLREKRMEFLKAETVRDEQKRQSQTLQEETRAEFEKLKSERKEITDLEEEADRMLREAEMELAMFAESFGAEMNEKPKKASPKPKKKPSPPVRRSVSPLLSHLREEGKKEPFIRDAVVGSGEVKSRLSLSVWGTSSGEAEIDGSDEEDLVEEEKLLENELEKLHEMEMTWAQEHTQKREEKKRKWEEEEVESVTTTLVTTFLDSERKTPDVVVVKTEVEEPLQSEPVPVVTFSKQDEALKNEIELQRLELEKEKRSLELARQKQRAEAERLEEEMRLMEQKRREMEARRRKLEEETILEEERLKRAEELRHREREEAARRRREEEEREREEEKERRQLAEEKERRRLAEEEQRRLAEEEERRLAEEEERRLAEEEERRLAEEEERRLAEEEERRLAEEEERVRRAAEDARQQREEELARQEQLERELRELELVDQQRRGLEEEEQRESYHEDMAFIKQVANAADRRNPSSTTDEDLVTDEAAAAACAEAEAIREEKVRRMREDIAHTVRENEDRRRPADGNRRSKLFVAHTEFDDSSGIFTTEM